MKEIDPDFRNIDGYPVVHVSMTLSAENGLRASVHEHTVTSKPGALYCGAQEFLSYGSRHHFDHVYELHGVGTAASLPCADASMSMFCYCIPENKEECLRTMKTVLANTATQRFEELRRIADQWDEQSLKLQQHIEDEHYGKV